MESANLQCGESDEQLLTALTERDIVSDRTKSPKIIKMSIFQKQIVLAYSTMDTVRI